MCGFDEGLLVDLITASETSALELLLMGCKSIVSLGIRCDDDDEEEMHEMMQLLSSVRSQIHRLWKKQLLPFNPRPLQRRMDDAIQWLESSLDHENRK